MADKRQQKRITITAHLIEGDPDDAALIDWIRQVKRGKAPVQQVVKNTLRAALGLPMPEPAESELRALVEAQQAQIDGLTRLVADQQRRLQQTPVNGVESDRIDALEAALQHADQWIGYFQQQIEALQNGYTPAPPPPVEPVTQQLDETEQAERAARMKKAKW